MGMFDFLADRGGYTYDDVQRRRALVDALAQTGSPRTFGEGLSSVGGAIGAILGGRRADSAEEKRAAMADGVFEAALGSVPQDNTALASALAPQTASFQPTGDTLRDGILETAQAIGADPLDLATAVSYETAGTFDPVKAGPTTQWGQHRGLIQFGEPQAQQYGADFSSPDAALASQLGADGAIANYFRSSGFKPGMSGLDLYSTINAGAPGRYSASDANNGGAPGSVADKWNNQMQDHRAKAAALLGGDVATGSVPVASAFTAQPAPVNVSLIRAMNNPYLSPEQKQILAGVMAQQQAQQITPYQQAQLQMAQEKHAFEMAQANQPAQVEYGWQTMPDGTLIRTDSAGNAAPVGQYGKPEEEKRPAPYTDMGKLKADLDAGYISQDMFNAASSGAGKAEKDMTESERRIFMFSNIQSQTSPVLDKLEADGFDPANIQDRFANGVLAGNWLRSEEGQQYRAAGSAWAEAALRLATGAAATPEEHARIVNTYFGQVGDSPETLKFKQRMRKSYETVLQATLNGDLNAEVPNPLLMADEVAGGDRSPPPPADGAPPPETPSDDDLINLYGG